MAQYELAGVVAAGCYRGPRIERRKLILIEASELAAAAWKASYVELVESSRFISTTGSPYVRIHILCRAFAPASCVRKHIFAVGNCGTRCQAVAVVCVN